MESIVETRPSFYEILMQDRLGSMLYSSIKFVISALTEKYSSLTPLRYYSEELASLFSGLIDLYYLLRTKGTFTENYYSLCRTITGKGEVFVYLALYYGLPLVFKQGWLKNCHDIAKGATMLLFLYFDFSYFTPEQVLLKQKIVRQQTQYKMGYALIGFLLALKSIELYFTTGKKKTAGNFRTGAKPPYAVDEAMKGICPICKRKWVNPTALSCSGYIFCYSCIRAHVEVFSACPVSKIKASMVNLRKLHIES
jgi:hypothetical protein